MNEWISSDIATGLSDERAYILALVSSWRSGRRSVARAKVDLDDDSLTEMVEIRFPAEDD